MTRSSDDIVQLISLLYKHQNGLDWYELVVALGWQCRGNHSSQQSRYRRPNGPEVCHCVRDRLHAARIAARRQHHVIHSVKLSEDGRRDIYVIDNEGDYEKSIGDLDQRTRTSMESCQNDVNSLRQVRDNPLMPVIVKELVEDQIVDLIATARRWNTIRRAAALPSIKLRAYMSPS